MVNLLSPGTWLQSRYLIQRVLGQGGMGAVYLALDARLDQNPVAVKENLDTTPQAQTQFQHEANVLARLSHPNLPKVSDHFIEPSGRQYLVMEYVAGDDLDMVVQPRGALPEAQVLVWAAALLDALAYLHSQPQPVIHRDIKPANIKLTPDGHVKLVDFGLVKLCDTTNPYTKTIVHNVGSPQYAPPEQFNPAGHTDARSDIYSLGATLYHLLTGQAPATATDRVVKPQAFAPPRRINAAIAPSTEVAILKAMELPADRRFQTAMEMRAALRGRTDAPPPVNWQLVIGGAVTVGLVGVMILVAWLGFRQAAGRVTPVPFPTTPGGMLAAAVTRITPTVTATGMPITPPSAATTRTPTATQPPTHTPMPEMTETPLSSTPIPTNTPVVVTPAPTETPLPQVSFEDSFSSLDFARWVFDKGTGEIAVSNGALRLSSSRNRYPYVYTRVNPFPSEGNFQLEFRFRYAEVRTCGVGVIMTGYLVPRGLSQNETASRQRQAEANGVQAGVWQDASIGMQLWFRSGTDRKEMQLGGPDTSWNEMAIQYSGGQYLLYLNGRLSYTSASTPHRPQYIWIGHPADLGGDCQWDTLEVDSVRVESVP